MTNKIENRLFPFDRRNEHEFEDEAVFSCYLGKVFQFEETRSVWGSRDGFFGATVPNWRNTYPGYESFSLDLSIARKKVSDRRTQGSRWTIWELPVVVISGQVNSLLIGEFGSIRPLKGFVPLRKRLFKLEEYGTYFQSDEEHPTFQLVCRAGLISPATLPFYRHCSESHGGNSPLRWPAKVARYDLEGALGVICSITKRLQRRNSK